MLTVRSPPLGSSTCESYWMTHGPSSRQRRPFGIDLVAEASLRSMMGVRLMRAAKAGETDRATLKAFALNGL